MAQVASNWYELGATLLEERQESHLRLIQSNHSSDVKKCCLAMLQYWMDTHSEATWHQLVTALKSPGVDLAVAACDIEKDFIGKNDVIYFLLIMFVIYQYIVDHTHGGVNNSTDSEVDFADFENVADAFAVLMRVFAEELHNSNFEIIRAICLTRAHPRKRLQNEIAKTTNIYSLFELLASNPSYFNWINVDYLQTIALASNNEKLQNIMKNYNDVVLSKTLGEIWSFIPSFHQTRTKYYSKIKAKFHGMDPDDITVKDLKKYEPKFAKEIALHIMEIGNGSLIITWCILAEEAYQAYLLALSVPQELMKDDFLQIGTWIVFHPQLLIKKLTATCG